MLSPDFIGARMRSRYDPHPCPPHKREGEHYIEKALLALGLLFLFGMGYFGIGAVTDPARAHSLAIALDFSLPFRAAWVWVYIWVIPAAVAPLFFIRSYPLYRRAILAYALVIALACLVFLIYPVSAAGLRTQATLDVAQFSDRMVAVLYRVDPSINAFPSLHLALASLAAITVWRAFRSMGLALALSVPAVALAVCLVKQHFVLDAVAGILLALLIGLPIIGAYRPAVGEIVGYSWRGPALFAVFALFSYAIVAAIGQWFPL